MDRKVLALVAICLFTVTFAYAQEKGKTNQKAEAKAMVEKAVAFVKAKGKENALAEFNKPDGKFVRGSLYVFAYDLNGVLVGHPTSKHVGENLLNEPDNRGNFFKKDIIATAKKKGKGWVDYFYLNPQSGKEEAKTTYLQKVGDMVVCCGIYK